MQKELVVGCLCLGAVFPSCPRAGYRKLKSWLLKSADLQRLEVSGTEAERNCFLSVDANGGTVGSDEVVASCRAVGAVGKNRESGSRVN